MCKYSEGLQPPLSKAEGGKELIPRRLKRWGYLYCGRLRKGRISSEHITTRGLLCICLGTPMTTSLIICIRNVSSLICLHGFRKICTRRSRGPLEHWSENVGSHSLLVFLLEMIPPTQTPLLVPTVAVYFPGSAPWRVTRLALQQRLSCVWTSPRISSALAAGACGRQV